ncbi:CpaD family pilus assembly protein [Qipengyuania sediminis]|uniref:CpaD family pilus assembly protein n=1 Tax=Qipengyuania sediminis TaxID=1532023 RepID=UPI001F10E40F|nr:CpaD family pilus assembly lipoprotein [Qipengyuania sediminis]
MRNLPPRPLTGAFALSLCLALAACGGMPSNRSVYSVKQPVVERTAVSLDVTTGTDGLALSEQRRIGEWFDVMDLRYGDRVSLEDPLASPATEAAVAQLAGRHGLLMSQPLPSAASDLQPGQARVTIARSRASVPGCPDWSESSDSTLGNGTSANYGCATNGNLAAMVADPEDLLAGRKGSTETYINTATTPIKAYATQVGTKVNQAQSGALSGGN